MDYILDLGGGSGSVGEGTTGPAPCEGGSADGSFRGRPWLSVHWRCCEVYSRVYRNRAGTAYLGRCPRCGKPLRIKIAAGGTSARFFEAY